MKVFAVSDLHLSINSPKPMDIFGPSWENYLDKITASWEEKVSDEDVVLLTGDHSWAMNLESAVADLQFIGKHKGKKIIIRGNHDYWWKSISAVRAALPPNMYALQNDCIKLDNIIFCGSRGWAGKESWTNATEDKKIYDRELIRMQLSLDSMQKLRNDGDKVIVMIHYPPFGSRFDDSPFTALFEQYRADAVVYGHLHGKESRTVPFTERAGIGYYLTSCDILGNTLTEIKI